MQVGTIAPVCVVLAGALLNSCSEAPVVPFSLVELSRYEFALDPVWDIREVRFGRMTYLGGHFFLVFRQEGLQEIVVIDLSAGSTKRYRYETDGPHAIPSYMENANLVGEDRLILECSGHLVLAALDTFIKPVMSFSLYDSDVGIKYCRSNRFAFVGSNDGTAQLFFKLTSDGFVDSIYEISYKDFGVTRILGMPAMYNAGFLNKVSTIGRARLSMFLPDLHLFDGKVALTSTYSDVVYYDDLQQRVRLTGMENHYEEVSRIENLGPVHESLYDGVINADFVFLPSKGLFVYAKMNEANVEAGINFSIFRRDGDYLGRTRSEGLFLWVWKEELFFMTIEGETEERAVIKGFVLE